VKLNDNQKTGAGKPFADPFRLKVVSGAAAADPGVPDAALLASYAEIRSGSKQMRAVPLKTGADGVASFTHPVPEFVGSERLTVGIDLSAHLASLRKLPKDLQVMVGGLEDLAAKKRAVFSLEVISQARDIPTGIAVASLDIAGTPWRERFLPRDPGNADWRASRKSVASRPHRRPDDTVVVAAAAGSADGRAS
jgi:hypothetical protein